MTRATLLASAALALGGFVPAGYDPDAEVDVELVLAVDISQSMDADEQELQRAGYAAAVRSADFLHAVQMGPIGRIAVTYVEWGGIGEQYVIAPWQVIDGEDSADHFAEEIETAPPQKRQRTSIASVLTFAAASIQTNDFQGLRKVIDVSGDGPNNQGGSVTEAREAALAMGITINGLPLLLKKDQTAWSAVLDLEAYYEDCVIGGPGAFSIPVRSQSEFADAIRMKLVLEIAGLQPEARVVPAAGRERTNCSLFD